jgi:hypothetical protein
MIRAMFILFFIEEIRNKKKTGNRSFIRFVQAKTFTLVKNCSKHNKLQAYWFENKQSPALGTENNNLHYSDESN